MFLLKNCFNYIFDLFYYNYKFLYIIKFVINNNLDELDYNTLEKFKKDVITGGPLTIKFMQWYLSNEFVDDYKNTILFKVFNNIFDNCPAHSIKNTEKIFFNDFGKEFSSLFDTDDLKLIGSGSIGQVYKCKMNSGLHVAMKVKHPDSDYILGKQKIILNTILFLQKHEFLRRLFKLHFNLAEFLKDLHSQIDFKNEVFNCLKIRKNFYNNESIIIPKIYNYSNNIIIYSYEDGIEFDDLSLFKQQKVGMNFYCMLIQMVMFDNFIHCDLHSKNWKIRKSDKDYKIVLYDFGLCHELANKQVNMRVWEAFESNKTDIIVDNLEHLVCKDKLNSINDIDKDFLKNTLITNAKLGFSANKIFKLIINFLKKKNMYVNKTLFNIIIMMVLLQDLFKKTNLTCNKNCNLLEKKKILLNRICDLLAYTGKYNYYNNLNNYFENRRVNILNDIKTKNV